MDTKKPLTYEQKKEIMKTYLLLKFEIEDWHGVADAAMDIRELESEHKSETNGHQD